MGVVELHRLAGKQATNSGRDARRSLAAAVFGTVSVGPGVSRRMIVSDVPIAIATGAPIYPKSVVT